MSTVRVLHITNGDAAAERIRQAAIPGDIIPWRDILHDGPVPSGLSIEELSKVRGEYLASAGFGSVDEIVAQLDIRNVAIARAQEYSQIILWFEHDLYDQLQLVQILDWFANHDGNALPISLICIGAYPGVPKFTGLGQLTGAQMRRLLERRRKITDAEWSLATAAWAAFTAPNPMQLAALARGNIAALRFLRAALVRHLEDFPHIHGGLSRTEKQLVEVIRDGSRMPVEIFIAAQERESAPFLGDASVWATLRRLSSGDAALLEWAGGTFKLPGAGRPGGEFLRQSAHLTELGKEVAAGRADWVAIQGIDRWLGGVHLEGRTVPWRWEERRGRLISAP